MISRCNLAPFIPSHILKFFWRCKPIHNSQLTTHNPQLTPWFGPLIAIITTGISFCLYLSTMAPGLTWAYEGADGGELLAAAIVNGVPHPPGYPLYIPILRAWLIGIGWLLPDSDLAWRGNLLSAIFAALSVGVTTFMLGSFMRERFSIDATFIADKALPKEMGTTKDTKPSRRLPQKPHSTRQFHNQLTAQQLFFQNAPWVWAAIASLTVAISPLFWGQALITEVYTLHLLFISLLGWALFGQQGKPHFLIPAIALGVAHNATFLLLLPAAFYYLWSDRQTRPKLTHLLRIFAVGGFLGLCFYLRIPLVASNIPPPPVNWGYADNGAGFVWLTTAQAYRGYFFDFPLQELFGRLTAWAYVLTLQFTPIGLGIALIGLAYLDSLDVRFRNFILLWIAPVSLYSMGYYTRDNDIYLLAVIWIFAILIAVALYAMSRWLVRLWIEQNNLRQHLKEIMFPILAIQILGILGVALLLFGRISSLSLHEDREAERFVTDVIETIEPQSIVVSNGDQETFALWYSAWATGELLQSAPETVLINISLYQFPWYQRLLEAQYPALTGIGLPFEAFLRQNMRQRSIYTSEQLPIFEEEFLTPIGPLWQYHPVTISSCGFTIC